MQSLQRQFGKRYGRTAGAIFATMPKYLLPSLLTVLFSAASLHGQSAKNTLRVPKLDAEPVLDEFTGLLVQFQFVASCVPYLLIANILLQWRDPRRRTKPA